MLFISYGDLPHSAVLYNTMKKLYSCNYLILFLDIFAMFVQYCCLPVFANVVCSSDFLKLLDASKGSSKQTRGVNTSHFCHIANLFEYT